MKKIYYFPIMLSTLLIVGLDYFYANHFHPIVWSLLIIPIILFLTIYPYWRLALIAAIVVSSVISVGLLNNEISEAIIKSIMTLAKQLNLNTIAEGIENQDQLKKVWQEDCKQMQGYYYSPPVAPEQIETLLGRSRGSALLLPNDVFEKTEF